MIARIALMAVALAAAAVLAADLRTAREVDAAVADAKPTPAAVRVAARQLGEIAAGTSDPAPLLRSAQLQLAVQDYRGALATALAAARREPENAQAWLLVGFAARGARDARAAAAEARRHIAQLVARP